MKELPMIMEIRIKNGDYLLKWLIGLKKNCNIKWFYFYITKVAALKIIIFIKQNKKIPKNNPTIFFYVKF